MTCLLDTHTFLWSAFTPRRLSRSAHAAIMDPENNIFVSAVTFWEIALKHALGKITLEAVTPDDLPEVARRMGFDLLRLDADDAASFHRLPRIVHKDPFDRMLVHQAMRGHHTLISCDPDVAAYGDFGLKLLW